MPKSLRCALSTEKYGKLESVMAYFQVQKNNKHTVSKTRLLSFLGRESLDRLQVEIVVEMQVVQILTVNEQIEHVVTLTADL
jgi:hypothetical protein